ncbi:protein of unknown function DUF29 [Beggiatoa alba B18LD]|uniref:DUF29 domain-containing protein n=1 Tax=Beggiatoa alba B18LD TaxID=395493 RepID=I3CL79_9GAMM|nr:DUF29 domain-containing protein [Beggiatoa alba]EIJ44372.1 protein of unknown function DUF29 [Beggiatoa alba B18LD]
MKTSDLYEKDVNEWVTSQIQLLKSGKLELIDIEHLIEELQDMGKSNRRELSNHLKILIAHLLKWQYQLKLLIDKYNGYEGKSWKLTIIEQRFQLMDLLEDIPSLKRELQETIKKSYPKAVLLAVKETNLPQAIFPVECPYTIEQLLDDDFYPH